MINVKKLEVDKYNCLLCDRYIPKEHYFSKEHIDNFKNNITINTRDSIKNKFVDLIFDFHILDRNVFYKDFYFKDYLKKLIIKNCDDDKNYKITLYKFNQALVKNNDIKYWVEKYFLHHIDDINNIDKLKIKNNRNDLDLINIGKSEIPNHNPEDNLEELNILSMHEDYDSSIMTIQNRRLIVKISECDIFYAGNEIDKIPEIFFKKRNLLIIRNDDNKCFLYCYIRKFKNVITNKAFRITKKDLLIAEEIIDEYDMDFENVSLDELDKIEYLLKVNIHIFGCNKKFNSKKIIRKSKSNFDNDLDLLLIDEIKHYILIKNINKFVSDNSHVIKTCRNCLNVFYSELKYKEHIEYCQFGKPKKLIEDLFPDFGIRVSTDNTKNKNIIENKIKIVHHDHYLEKNNIIGYICRECNLQIKNNKSIPMYFFNGMKYDNYIILKSICDLFKNNVTLNVIGNSCESFKMIDFKFKKIKYSLKLLDMCNFIKGSLNDLSKNLNDKNKIVTREHFKDNFELMKYKVCFPYEFVTRENIYNKELPPIENFYSSLKLDNISEEDYDKTLEIYEKLNCKNIKEYLDIYLKLDICLQADIFNVFRKCIWDKFEIDCSKYITSCSLSLDLMLKYTGVKIELIRDISIFDYVNSSILGGVCIASQNISNDKDGVISSCDIVSLYPYVMSKKLPVSNYKFVKYFDRDRYLDSNYSCLLNCEIYTTDKVKNDSILKQYPALISKTSVKYNDLSEFQRKNLKENYKSSEKLISHLGYDKNCYLSFDMYEMMISLGYEIVIKKILEYKHSNFMKPYIDFLFEKKSYYKKIGDNGMSNTFKILANSLFGVMMTRCEKFKGFKIVTKESQVDKQIKKPNFSCRNIINENLTILEMEKTSVIYNYPILIGSIILQNSKVHMFNYLYKIYPRLFGNYKVLYQDTDSIYAKLNISHDECLKILEENKELFGDSIIGQMEVEKIDNPIKEFIALSSKCYSYICKNNIENNKNKLKNNIAHTKGISDSYKNKYIDHNLFKKTLIENMKPDKISFNDISVKNQQIKTNTIVKNNIEFLNDKRYISDINENIPHS